MKRSLPFLTQATSTFLSQQAKSSFILDLDEDNKENSDLRAFLINYVLCDGLGLSSTDKRLTDSALLKSLEKSASDERNFSGVLSDFISKNAQISWSTHGHTGVDVNLYAYGYASSLLKGFHSNNEIGRFLANLLDLDLDAVTRVIRTR